MSVRIAVLGDVHANASALKAALSIAGAWRTDQTVLLGDLLTYGVDVQEVLDIVAKAVQRPGTTLLRGNHDALYQDLRCGNDSYYRKLPGWLRECADATVEKIDWGAFERLPFQDEHVVQRILFTHANPFGAGDWEYLNSLDQHLRASRTLAARSLDCGVFGHTHRPKVFSGAEFEVLQASGRFSIERRSGGVINAGSVGQPRGHNSLGHVLLLEADAVRIEGKFEALAYDRDAHVQKLFMTNLSRATQEKLASYFVAGA